MDRSIPAVSLIICSRDRPKLLLETVNSVLAGDFAPAEILVVDQSTSPNPGLDRFSASQVSVRYLRTSSIGLSRARNIGLAASRNPIIVFIDDDMQVARDWLNELVGALVAAGPFCVVTGQVPPARPEPPGHFAPSIKIDLNPAAYQGRIWQDVLYANNMAFFRASLDKIGGFDERLGAGSRFPSAEDNDFGFRLLEAGYRILYVPSAVAYHRAWRPMRIYLPLRWDYGRGQGAFYAKYLTVRDPYMLRRLLRDVRSYLLRFVFRLRHDRVRALGDAAYAAAMICGVMQFLAVRISGHFGARPYRTGCDRPCREPAVR